MGANCNCMDKTLEAEDDFDSDEIYFICLYCNYIPPKGSDLQYCGVCGEPLTNRKEFQKEMRMRNQQTGNGFGGARVPSIRTSPRYGSHPTPRSSALALMQLDSDLEGESETNNTGEVIAHVKLRTHRKVPSHAVIGSRTRAWSAPAQITGTDSRKLALEEMRKQQLADIHKDGESKYKDGEESVEVFSFPEKLQSHEKNKNISGETPPTLWGSPNEGEDS